jgi:hypothetical protein
MEVATADDIEAGHRDTFLFAPSSCKRHFEDEETMERRTFLNAVTGVSLGLLWDLASRELAWAQNAAQAAAGPGTFETSQVEISGNTVCVATETGRLFCWCTAFPAQA